MYRSTEVVLKHSFCAIGSSRTAKVLKASQVTFVRAKDKIRFMEAAILYGPTDSNAAQRSVRAYRSGSEH